MNFLSPWFLLGAAAIAGPIVFHLIRRIARERMTFSSLMFLKPTPPRVTRLLLLEHFWLLLLRCLCLLLLAVGFARPFFSTNSAKSVSADDGRQLVLLLDTSASMKRDGVWEKARSIAEKYLAQTTPDDQVALLTFDRQPQTLVNFGEWISWNTDHRAKLAEQRLATISPSWMGTQLGLALTTAAEKFREDTANDRPVGRRELVLISDLQAGAKLDGLQGHDWPTGTKLILERVDAKPQSNAGLEIQNASAAAVGDDQSVRVRVANAGDSSREKFQLNWQSENGNAVAAAPMEIYLPLGQTRSFSAPKLPPGTTTAEIQLTGDEVDFDNHSYFAAPEAEHLTIAWFGLDAANDPAKMRYYFQRVFPDTPARQVKVIMPMAQQAFSPDLLNQSAFAVVPGRLTPEETTALHDWLARGKTALFVATDAESVPVLAALTGLTEIKMTEATGEYALLGDIDFTHPLFAPFADPRYSDFTHIHFWKHRHMEIPAGSSAHVLAKFDDGSPALAQIPVGSGNLLVLASGWNPADSQLALSSKFPPLMQTMLDWSGGATPARFQFETGDAIPSPVSDGGIAVQWQKPDGKKISLAAGTAFAETDLPGIYTSTFGDKRRQFAVNLPLNESRTAPMSSDELVRLGVPLETPSLIAPAKLQEVQLHLQRAELENRQKLWRWLIVGVLAVMFGEIILSGWLARREKTVEVTT